MRILLADDDAITRKALQRQFRAWGHELLLADDGNQAWELLGAEPAPRLAVLDWMMPGLDGPEICRRLRRRPPERLPVYAILLTSKNQPEDLAAGIASGAHDFVSKPVNPIELHSRIDLGTRFVASDDQLRAYATQMETLAEERARQLLHADRMATLGTMAAGVVHELGNPLATITGNTRLLEKLWARLGPNLSTGEDGEPPRLAERVPPCLEHLRGAGERMGRIINGMRTFAHRGEAAIGPCDLAVVVTQSLELCQHLLKYRVRVHCELAADLPIIGADGQQLEQLLVNLLTNAAHALEDGGGGDLWLRAGRDGPDHVVITVADSGPGLPPDALQDIWTPFYTTKSATRGTGLGLPICHGIARAHGGSITAANRSEGGACFRLRLPAKPRSGCP